MTDGVHESMGSTKFAHVVGHVPRSGFNERMNDSIARQWTWTPPIAPARQRAKVIIASAAAIYPEATSGDIEATLLGRGCPTSPRQETSFRLGALRMQYAISSYLNRLGGCSLAWSPRHSHPPPPSLRPSFEAQVLEVRSARPRNLGPLSLALRYSTDFPDWIVWPSTFPGSSHKGKPLSCLGGLSKRSKRLTIIGECEGYTSKWWKGVGKAPSAGSEFPRL